MGHSSQYKERNINEDTLAAIQVFFENLKKEKIKQRETQQITTNNALYYLIRKDPALRDEENKIKRELIELLGKEIFPASILLTEDLKIKMKTTLTFQIFLENCIKL